MENVRRFVDGGAPRRRATGGGPVVDARHGCCTEVLLEMDVDDPTAGRKSVRFDQVVRVCDPTSTSTITFCNLRHQSASAPAVLGGGRSACSLPPLTSGHCVVSGGGSKWTEDRADGLDLPAEVERCMARRQRRRVHNADTDLPLPQRSNDEHRFPPFRRRPT